MFVNHYEATLIWTLQLETGQLVNICIEVDFINFVVEALTFETEVKLKFQFRRKIEGFISRKFQDALQRDIVLISTNQEKKLDLARYKKSIESDIILFSMQKVRSKPCKSLFEKSAVMQYRKKLPQLETQSLLQKIQKHSLNQIETYAISKDDVKRKNGLITPHTTCFQWESDIWSGNLPSIVNQAKEELRQNGCPLTLFEIYRCFQDEKENLSNAIEETAETDDWERKMELLSKIRTGDVSRSGPKFSVGIERSLNQLQNSIKACKQSWSVSKFLLIENRSKNVKKDIDDRKDALLKQAAILEQNLKKAHEQHHSSYQARQLLRMEEINSNKIKKVALAERVSLRASQSNFLNQKKTMKSMKEKNLISIQTSRLAIEKAQLRLAENNEEMNDVKAAEQYYYRWVLRYGVDCRDFGLIWALKGYYTLFGSVSENCLPNRLDKKSRQYLINKLECILHRQQLIKRRDTYFQELMKCGSKTPQDNSERQLCSSEEEGINNRNSQQINPLLRDLQNLDKQMLRRQSIFERPREYLGVGLDSRNAKAIYKEAGRRINKFNFRRSKKDKSADWEEREAIYKRLSRELKQTTDKIEEADLRQQSYLTTQYGCNKDEYFLAAAVCFGYRQANSSILKKFN